MKTIRLSPALIVVLAVLLVLAAACNRPDVQQALETPQPMNVPQQPVGGATGVPEALSVEATPTLNISSGGAVNLGVNTPAPGATQVGAPAAQGTPEVPGPQVAGTPAPGAPATQQAAAPTTQPAPANPATTGGNQSYTVKSGDTLFSIGRLYSVNPYAIAAANNIPYPYVLYPGQQLIIPTGSTTAPTPPPGQTPPTPMPPAPAPVPPHTGGCRYYHVILPGENLFRISLAYGVPMSTIAAANGISNYNLIYAGETLCIP